jgi:hypothetical protein
MYLKELELLDFIDQQGCPNASLVAAKAGGAREYENYFGETGALTRKTMEIPHPITGVKNAEEYCMVEIRWDGRTKLHKVTEQGQRYRKFLRELIYFWGRYAEVRGGKLRTDRE